MFKIKQSLGQFVWIINASAWGRTWSWGSFVVNDRKDLTGGELMTLFSTFLRHQSAARKPPVGLKQWWFKMARETGYRRKWAAARVAASWDVDECLHHGAQQHTLHPVLPELSHWSRCWDISKVPWEILLVSVIDSSLFLSILSKLLPKKKLEHQISVIPLVSWGSQSIFLAGVKRNVRTAKSPVFLLIILYVSSPWLGKTVSGDVSRLVLFSADLMLSLNLIQ